MYIPRSFAMADDELQQILTEARVGDYVTTGPGGLQATYLPVVYDPTVGESGAFHLHLMRVNPQWQATDEEALLILHGNTHVIMASYYEDGASVGTLNYETVHVYGHPVVRDEIPYLVETVRRVAELNEQTWRLDDMDPTARDKMLRAAVGVEFRITRIEAKAKLSQNKRPDVIEKLAGKLAGDGNDEAAELLRTRSLPGARERQAVIDAAAERHRRRS